MSPKDMLLSWGMICAGVIMNVSGMYLIKMRMNVIGSMEVGSARLVLDYFLMLLRSPAALAGGVLFMAAPLPLAVALSRMELSVAYPLSFALSCLIIVPLTAIFFGETVNPNKIVAMALIIASLYFLYRV